MVNFVFDARAIDALQNSPYDPDQAVTLLKIAAEYIRAGKALPLGLDRHIAEAFESAATAPAGSARTNELLARLHLKRKGGTRPSVKDAYAVGEDVEYWMQRHHERGHPKYKPAWEQGDAIEKVALLRGLTGHKVRARYREYVRVRTIIDRIDREESVPESKSQPLER